MTQYGYHLCDGCDECRVRTIAADDEAFDWPCCEHFTDNKAPCRYAVIARCTSRVTIDVPDCLSDTTRWVLLWAVTELRKSCYVGCEWAFRPTCAADSNDDYTGALLDMTTNALNPAFPPAALDGDVLTFHEADYRSGEGGCIAPNTCNGDFDPDCVNTLDDRWTLAVSGLLAGEVTFTLTDPNITAWATANSKEIPVYENVTDWEPFGRNRMDIAAGYDDFPMLPKSICVVALDEPGADDNPCDDQDSRCECNDFEIGETGTMLVNITGCDGINGLHTVTVTRTCPPTGLPCGISYPASTPCCIFLGGLSTGDGCVNDDGSWSGALMLMVYCDPTAAAAARYNVKLYCYDNVLECWVEQGVTVDLVVLLCWGTAYIEFTITELDCCCPDGVETCCCAELLPATMTGTVSYSGGTCAGCNSSVDAVYNPSNGRWEGTSEVCPGFTPWFRCIPDPICTWECEASFVVSSVTCDPPMVVLTFEPCIGVTGTITFTA